MIVQGPFAVTRLPVALPVSARLPWPFAVDVLLFPGPAADWLPLPFAVAVLPSPTATAMLPGPFAVAVLPLPTAASATLPFPDARATFGSGPVDGVLIHAAVPLCTTATPLIDTQRFALDAPPAGPADNATGAPPINAMIARGPTYDVSDLNTVGSLSDTPLAWNRQFRSGA
jgi:hypothetical protein